MRIHKAGHWVIPIAAVAVAGLYLALFWLLPVLWVRGLLAVAAVVFFVLIVRFFRDPVIECPQKAGVVYAPADGKVVVVENTHEGEYRGEESIQISIFMSPLNVHVNRSSVSGIIDYFKYHKGKYLVAWHPKSSTDNERTTIGMTTGSGIKITTRQIAGAVARRIFFYPGVGDALEQGEKMGFIRFGSRLDVFVPVNAEILTEIGAKTKGGITELARLEK